MDYCDRLIKVIGESNFEKLTKTHVLLVGLGGVGGACFDSLVRSGIGNISVCDFDVFEETNLNRQLLSNVDTIGLKKVDVANDYAKKINDICNIVSIYNKLTRDNINDIIPSNINYIIDACDDINVKVALVKYAIENNIKIISSMGTGNKLKPELLEITNIWKTNYDPLAKKMRSLLKKENISYKLPVVSSRETPIKNGNYVGSFAPVVNTAGLLLASYVLNDIINKK